MENIAAEGKYRIVETIVNTPAYCLYKGIDIQGREHGAVLINRYAGAEQVREMLPVLHRLNPTDMPGFGGLNVQKGSVDAVFSFPRGRSLYSAYPGRSAPKREEAYRFVESLLLQSLLFANLPMAVRCAAADPKNVYVDPGSQAVSFHMALRPAAPATEELLMDSLTRCICKLLRKRYCMMAFELDFLDELLSGGYGGISAVYSAWREVCFQWSEEAQRVEALRGLPRLVFFFGQHKKRAKRTREYRSRVRQRQKSIKKEEATLNTNA